MSLKPGSIWSSSLAQTAAGLAIVTVAGWQVRGYTEEMRGEIRALREDVAGLRESFDKQVITQAQAERYAAAFRWENRGTGVVVPDLRLFIDSPVSRAN